MLLARALIGLEDVEQRFDEYFRLEGSATLMNQRDYLPKSILATLTIVLLPVISVGCRDWGPEGGAENTSTTSRIDSDKVLDLSRQLVLHITIFTYEEADFRGWPAVASQQKYVRYLQDAGVRVGFRRDPDSGFFAAMVEAQQVEKVIALDKAARAAGIEKPRMVPESAPN